MKIKILENIATLFQELFRLSSVNVCYMHFSFKCRQVTRSHEVLNYIASIVIPRISVASESEKGALCLFRF